MTRRLMAWIGCGLTIGLVLAGTVVARRQGAAGRARGGIVGLMPPGAVMVVQATDLKSLMRDWNDSHAKAAWLASANYQAFSRSRLFLRLQEAHGEFATAAGVPPDMALVSDIAGSESALALYDIGKLEFLYVTKLPAAQAMENALFRARGDFEPREAAGTPFYVSTDKDSDRTVAFGARDGYLLLATREDLLAGALTLIASAGANATAPAAAADSIAGDAWYVQAVKAAGTPGELRMVMDLSTLTKEPHFRSYWIQENVSELKAYASAVSDLVRTASDLRETRVLVRATEVPAPASASAANTAALNDLLHAVPATAGLYRAWTAPSAADATRLVFEKVIATSTATGDRDRTAPTVSTAARTTGSADDLESRIDQETRAPKPATYEPAALDRLIAAEPLTGLLQVESTSTGADGLFVNRGAVIVVARATDWPHDAARDALRTYVEPVWTKANLGLRWTDTRVGAGTPIVVSHLEGLEQLAIAERGHLLFIANDLTLLTAALDASASATAGTAPAAADAGTGATYAAGFRHAQERDRFKSLTGLIDQANSRGQSGEPPFFSGNLASLSDTLSNVDSATITTSDAGATVSQTVTYRLRR